MPRLPRPKLPRPKLPRPRLHAGGRLRPRALVGRLLAALRRVRYMLGDFAYVAGRGLAGAGRGIRAVGRRARRLWMRLSLATRQRIAAGAALGALGALVWFALLPGLPCRFPAGEVCPPGDDAAEVVPGDALAYAHANLDPDTEPYQAAAEIGRTLPSITAQALAALPQAAGLPPDFEGQIRPWLAGELALALVPGEGGRPTQVLLFEVSDEDGAREFAALLAAGPVTEREHHGVTMRVDRSGTASAIADGFLLVGGERAVERSIEVATGEGRSLASSPLGEQVLDSLPDEAVVQLAASEEGVASVLARRGAFETLEAFVDFDASEGAGAALVAEESALELVVHSRLDPERLEASPGFFDAFVPFDPTLAEELDPGTLAYLGLGDPAVSVEGLFSQAIAQAPGIALGLSDLVDRLRERGQVDAQEEILPLLEGEAALAIEPANPPYVTFVGDDVDPEPAREALAKLQGPLAEALDPARSRQSPVFSDREIEGVEAHSLRLSPTVELTYALFDDKLVVATDPKGIAQVRGGEGGLPGTEAFERATEELPETPSLLAYLNLNDLVALAEREGLAEDPSYALFAADVRRLLSLGLAVQRGETTLETTVRIAIEG